MKHTSLKAALLILACAGGAYALAQQPPQPGRTTPPGESKSGKTRTLEAGAKLLQGNAPLHGFDVYLDGFHPLKDQPQV